MRGTFESSGQMTMIAYLRVVWREWFLAHVTVRSAIKFFKIISREFHGDISR